MGAPVLQQVNVRLPSALKRDAEEVLSVLGLSATEVIRRLYAKIARGAQDCTEALRVLDLSDGEVDLSLVEEGWSLADAFCRSIGCNPEEVAKEDRPWDEIYAEAMDKHFAEKGLLS